MKNEIASTINIDQKIPSLVGLVLCGGQSKRMGIDKGTIEYFNKNQRQHIYEMLSPHCEATFLSCNEEQSKNINGLPKIIDCYKNIGPLNGILSGFKYRPQNALLTVPCDLPFLNNATINYLITNRDASKMATVFMNVETNFLEPLVCIWEPAANDILVKYFDENITSPANILMQSDVSIIHYPDASVFKNVNTIQEYSETLALLNKRNV
jgi:molybdopterin-guanine dinucleotide biosynthesis protein A